MRIALSTVACHDWPLDRVVAYAEEIGYQGVEFRSLGPASTRFASEPTQTGTGKIRALLTEHGMQASAIATSITFDAPIFPPILGRAFQDHDRPVRDVRRAIELAAAIGCPFVRVFGFRTHGSESRKAALRRICERLELAGAAARHTGVEVLVENGGSFARAEDLGELLDRMASPLVRAAYSVSTAHAAGDDPAAGIAMLGERCRLIRVKDLAGGRPVMLGDGGVPVQAAVEAAARGGLDQTVVFEWDRAWLPDLAEPQDVLPAAAERMYGWALAGSRVAAQPA